MSTVDEPTVETKTQVVIRLLKQGGYVLIAGGGVSELPERIRTHPQIILWDDNKQGVEQKAIPSNTRCIVYNRWISHTVAGRLRVAAQKLNIPVFPMLRTQEIKLLLSEVIHEPVVSTVPAVEVQVAEEPIVPEQAAMLMAGEMPVGKLRNLKRGELVTILRKELGEETNYSKEARRLVPIFHKKYGVKATDSSVAQAIRVYRMTGGSTNPDLVKAKKDESETRPATAAQVVSSLSKAADDFSEAERLLKDARSALDLMLEFIPKLRKQIDAQKKRQEKIRALLGDD